MECKGKHTAFRQLRDDSFLDTSMTPASECDGAIQSVLPARFGDFRFQGVRKFLWAKSRATGHSCGTLFRNSRHAHLYVPVRQGVHTTELEPACHFQDMPGGRAEHPLLQSLRYDLLGSSRASISSSPSERDNRRAPAAAVLQNTVKKPCQKKLSLVCGMSADLRNSEERYRLFAACRLICLAGSSPSKRIAMQCFPKS